MANNTIDARGLSCPQPVILTQAAIKNGNKSFTVIVNNDVSKENVLRCITKNGLRNNLKEEQGDYFIEVSE